MTVIVRMWKVGMKILRIAVVPPKPYYLQKIDYQAKLY
jgi:hypothetical protein